MTARGRSQPDITVPTIPTIEIRDTRARPHHAPIRQFIVNGVRVQVEAMDGGVPDERDAAAAELFAKLHAACSIPPAPPRIEAWGPGQFDRLTVSPGVEIWLRATPEGRARMVSPGGDLDITDISSSLGTGLHEVGARAGQIRARLADRAARRSRR